MIKMKPIYIFKCWDSYFNPNIKCSEGFGGYENAKVVKCYTKIGVFIKKVFIYFCMITTKLFLTRFRKDNK